MFVDTEKKLLGLRLRRLREAKGQTQHELSTNAGVSQKHLGEHERGRGNPSLKSLQGVADALGLSVSDLFDMEQVGKPDDVLLAEIIKRLQTAKPEVLRIIHRALKP